MLGRAKIFRLAVIILCSFATLKGVLSQCSTVDEDLLDYCLDLVTYNISYSINVTNSDDAARQLYLDDLSIWLNQSLIPACEDQEYGETMCNDCLAIRRRYHCATQFPRCTPSEDEVGVCKGLCTDVNDRCSQSLDCSGNPDEDCSPASSLLPSACSIANVFLLLFFTQHFL